MNNVKYITLIVVSIGVGVSVKAQSTVDAFMLEGLGARAQGMGGAYSAVADDLSALYWNPAGLATQERPALMANYGPSSFDDTVLSALYGQPLGSFFGTLGWFERTSEEIQTTDAAGVVTGSQDFGHRVLALSLGAPGGPFGLTHGLTVKHIQSQFKPYDVSGLGLDLGWQAQWRSFRAGLKWQDIGATSLSGNGYAGGDAADSIPSRLRLGAAFLLKKEPLAGRRSTRQRGISAALAADLLVPLDGGRDKTAAYYGAEFWYEEKLGIRTGWNKERGASFGASIDIDWLRIDYSILLNESFDPENRLTTSLFFGKKQQ